MGHAHPPQRKSGEHSAWGVELDGPEATQPAWEAFLVEFGHELTSIYVDGYPDPSWGWNFDRLPDEVKNCQLELQRIAYEELGYRKERGPMGVELDPSEQHHLKVARVFGPYSIHTQANVIRADGTHTMPMILHDSSTANSIWMTPAELDRYKTALRTRGLDPDSFLEPLLEKPGLVQRMRDRWRTRDS